MRDQPAPVDLLLAELRRNLPDLEWIEAAPGVVDGRVVAGDSETAVVRLRISQAPPASPGRPPRWRLVVGASEPAWGTWAGRENIGLPPGVFDAVRRRYAKAAAPSADGFAPGVGVAGLARWRVEEPASPWAPPSLVGRLGGLCLRVARVAGRLRVDATFRGGSPRKGWPSRAEAVAVAFPEGRFGTEWRGCAIAAAVEEAAAQAVALACEGRRIEARRRAKAHDGRAGWGHAFPLLNYHGARSAAASRRRAAAWSGLADDAFAQRLASASAAVERWPAWKRRVLGGA